MSFPVEEKFIEKAEGDRGVRFPDSFRTKMMAMNGGEVFDARYGLQVGPFILIAIPLQIVGLLLLFALFTFVRIARRNMKKTAEQVMHVNRP